MVAVPIFEDEDELIGIVDKFRAGDYIEGKPIGRPKMRPQIGFRLKKIREEHSLSQEELAKAVGLSPEYISNLESGRRTPRLKTLNQICQYFKKDYSFFLEEKAETAFARLLQAEALDRPARRAARKFQRFCQSYLRLEELAGQRRKNAPLYQDITAEQLADEERRRLGLGTDPVRNAFLLFERNGCPIFAHALPADSKVAGIFVYLEAGEAAFAFVNSGQSPGQQVITAAHEYCHYLKDRREGLVIDTPDFFIDAFVSLYHPREHFAQVFAYRFLMPPAKIEELFARDLRSRPLSFEHILYLKRYFGVSIQAMLQWLRYLEHILPDEFEQYQKKDGDKLEKEAFGSLVPAARPSRSRSDFSDRGKLLTLEACRKKRITPEKLALLLRSDQKKGPLLIRSIP